MDIFQKDSSKEILHSSAKKNMDFAVNVINYLAKLRIHYDFHVGINSGQAYLTYIQGT